jgi:hypothetical protein
MKSCTLLRLAVAASVSTSVSIAATSSSDSVARDMAGPPGPLTVTSITPDQSIPIAAQVSYSGQAADSVRAHYSSADGSDTGITPWIPARSGAIPLLGLRAATTYAVTLESKGIGNTATGAVANYTTPPLPTALAGVTLGLVSGTAPVAGFTLASLTVPDGDGYLIAFDGSGSIRWFRDFGKIDVQEAKQQTNGDFTVFVGNSIGDNPTAGGFVEVTPEGDSVRTITATGSPYTDGHELQVVTDPNGHRVADYLFGYDIRSVDETATGGGASDQIAGHQLIRINAAGTVDTLLQGWNYWTPADKIDPPLADQSIDHPNSIDFDLDGGVIISYRNLGAILKIDPTTHAVLWQLGGTRNQFRFIGDPLNGFGGQHSVHVLPNGHFIVFDNGVTHNPQSSRAVEYAVDQSAMTATMVWQYAPDPPLFNEFTGSVQRLSNGNTVIAWTNAGLVDEVAPDGTLIDRMQIYNSPGVPNTSAYRAIRISSLYHYVTP